MVAIGKAGISEEKATVVKNNKNNRDPRIEPCGTLEEREGARDVAMKRDMTGSVKQARGKPFYKCYGSARRGGFGQKYLMICSVEGFKKNRYRLYAFLSGI